MTDNLSNNKRIAINTLMLYIRMFLVMAISLYTSRIILNTLGVEDFGIYNVVGGVITMLGFLSSSLSGAGSRFITYALGKGDKEELGQVYATVTIIHYLLAGIIVLLGETVGLWFVYNKLIIPVVRMEAALWVYHCSILTMVIAIISTPYNALIIAHEKMNIFAYISVVEIVLKLAIVFVLVYIPYDKLITYSIFLMLVQLLVRIAYNIYCRKSFQESKVELKWYPKLIKEMSVYAGWTINGNLAAVGYTQGINILLNLFFGPIVNAARGIAVQVQAAVMTFVSNFQTAVRPQIVKSYALYELKYMHSLIVRSSKFGYYLVLILAFPIILCIEPILKLWLGIVPEHTNIFVVIMLISGLIEPMKVALINAIHATGNIKKFQLYEGSALLTVIPISYVLLKFFSISPEMVICVYLIIQLLTQCIRVYIVLPKISMTYRYYFINVLKPVLFTIPFSIIPFFVLPSVIEASLEKLVLYMTIGVIYILICIFMVGINQYERKSIFVLVTSRFKNSLYNKL